MPASHFYRQRQPLMALALLLLLLVEPVTCDAPAETRALRSTRQTQAVQSPTPTIVDDTVVNTIVGGTDAAVGEFPFLVVFEGGVLCGGSLISPNRVLTAGHCLAYGAPEAVRVGATTTNNGEVVPVSCAIKHPDYFSPLATVVNDVAILKLERNVTTVTEFATFNTDANYPSVSGTPLTVAGFGKLANDESASDTLQKVGTFFITREECLESYSSLVVRPESHICGDVPNKGDCNGDSGGPLMDEAGTVVGIVSFGYGGCASDYPDVYTKVSTYSEWIQEQIDKDDDDDTSVCVNRNGGTGGGLFGACSAFLGYLVGVSHDVASSLSPWD